MSHRVRRHRHRPDQARHEARRCFASPAWCARRPLRALEDAGLGWRDIDAVVIGKAPDMFEGVMMPELYLADALGAAGKPMHARSHRRQRRRVDRDRGAHLIQAGIHERVLTVAFEKQSESDAMWALSPACRSSRRSWPARAATSRRIIRAYMRRSGAPPDIGHAWSP